MTTIRVEIAWDDASKAWHVCGSELSGLEARARTLEDLLRRVVRDLPALLSANGTPYEGQDITVRFMVDILVKNPLLGG
jgi:hypothetical protein